MVVAHGCFSAHAAEAAAAGRAKARQASRPRRGRWRPDRLRQQRPSGSTADMPMLSAPNLSAIVASRNDAAAVTPCLRALAAQGADEVCWVDDASDDETAEEAALVAADLFPRWAVRRNRVRRGPCRSLNLGSRMAGGGALLLVHAGAPAAALPAGNGPFWLSAAARQGDLAAASPQSIAPDAPLLMGRSLFDALGGVPDLPSCASWAFALAASWFCQQRFVPARTPPFDADPAQVRTARLALLRRLFLAAPLNPALPGPSDPARFWLWADANGMGELARSIALPYPANSRLLDPA